MLIAFEAGVQPGEGAGQFYELTFAENLRMINAYNRREYAADYRARETAFLSMLPHIDQKNMPEKYEIWPLRFDPTKKEREDAFNNYWKGKINEHRKKWQTN